MVEIDEAFAQVAEAIRARGSVPEEVIVGLEMLKSSVVQWLSKTGGTLYAPEHGRWIVSPSGVHLDLERRPTLRRLVQCLVEARLARPGEAVTSAELIAAGWPTQPGVTDASSNRLRVAICRLRQAALDHVLVTTSSGWMLKPTIPVERDANVTLEGLDTATKATETGAEAPAEPDRPKSGIFMRPDTTPTSDADAENAA